MKRKSLATSIVIAGLGVVSSASALPIVQNAAEFHAEDAADQASLVYTLNGVSNSSGSPKDIIGTVARNPHASGLQTVTVVGYNEDRATVTACTISAITPVPLGTSAVHKPILPSGVVTDFNHTWTRSVQFTAAEAGPFASFVVRCTIDGNNKSRIQSVRVTP